MQQWAGELVGSFRSKVCVIDGSIEELTETEAPLCCGRVEKVGADTLAHVSEDALSKDATCHGAGAESAYFATHPGLNCMEGDAGVVSKHAA